MYNEQNDYIYKAALSFCIIVIKLKYTFNAMKIYLWEKRRKIYLPLKSQW